MEGLTCCYLTCKVLNETLIHGLVNTWLNPNSHSPPGQTLLTRPKDFIPKPKSLLPCQLYFVVKLSLNQPLPLRLFIPFSQFLFKHNTALHGSPTNDLPNNLCVARISLKTVMTTWIKRPGLCIEDWNEMAVHWSSEDNGAAWVNSEVQNVTTDETPVELVQWTGGIMDEEEFK